MRRVTYNKLHMKPVDLLKPGPNGFPNYCDGIGMTLGSITPILVVSTGGILSGFPSW